MDEKVIKAYEKSLELLIFHAANALLIKKGIFAKTHNGTIRKFGLEYIANDDFSKEIGKFFTNLEKSSIFQC